VCCGCSFLRASALLTPFLAALAVVSCGMRDHQPDDCSRVPSSPRADAKDAVLHVRDSAGIRIVESFDRDQLGRLPRWTLRNDPHLRIGSLEEGPAAFGRIAGIAAGPDGTLYVSDALNFQIRAFSRVGEWRWSKGRLGDGPGEFRGVQGIELCGGRIVVADLFSRRLTVFDDAGSVLGTERWSPAVGGFVPSRWTCDVSGMWLQIDRESVARVEEGPHRVRAHLSTGAFGEKRVQPLGGDFWIDRYRHTTIDGPSDLGTSTLGTVFSGGVHIVDTGRAELRTYSSHGTLVRIVRWYVEPRVVTREFLREEADARSKVLRPEQRSTYRALWLSLRHPSVLPVSDTLIPVPGGGVWVRRFEPRSSGARHREWWMISADGMLTGVLEVPEGLSLRRVVPEGAIGVVRDSLGVQFVELRQVLERGDGYHAP